MSYSRLRIPRFQGNVISCGQSPFSPSLLSLSAYLIQRRPSGTARVGSRVGIRASPAIKRVMWARGAPAAPFRLGPPFLQRPRSPRVLNTSHRPREASIIGQGEAHGAIYLPATFDSSRARRRPSGLGIARLVFLAVDAVESREVRNKCARSARFERGRGEGSPLRAGG
jgi:hypothetical protein